MSVPDLRRERTPSKIELVFDLVKTRMWTLLVIGTAILLAVVYLGVGVSIPRPARIAGFGIFAITPYGYIVGKYIVSLLRDPAPIYLVDLDARVIDGALFEFSTKGFRRMETTTGELCELTPQLYVGKNVDIDEMTVEGTWRGTLSDRDLLRGLHKVEECRGQLEEDAKRGFAIETKLFTIVRAATKKATRHVVRTFERGTLPDEGESINEEIEAALERFDLEDDLKSIDPDILDPDVEELDQKPGDDGDGDGDRTDGQEDSEVLA